MPRSISYPWPNRSSPFPKTKASVAHDANQSRAGIEPLPQCDTSTRVSYVRLYRRRPLASRGAAFRVATHVHQGFLKGVSVKHAINLVTRANQQSRERVKSPARSYRSPLADGRQVDRFAAEMRQLVVVALGFAVVYPRWSGTAVDCLPRPTRKEPARRSLGLYKFNRLGGREITVAPTSRA